MANGTESKSNRNKVSAPIAIANLFNNYFTSLFNDDNAEEIIAPTCLTSPDADCSYIELTTDEIITTLLHLGITKATGPDGIPSRLLKETAWQIGPSLTQVFNKSLNLGKIPNEWKLSNIVPIHKKGKQEYMENTILQILSTKINMVSSGESRVPPNFWKFWTKLVPSWTATIKLTSYIWTLLTLCE